MLTHLDNPGYDLGGVGTVVPGSMMKEYFLPEFCDKYRLETCVLAARETGASRTDC